jgi:hypothetical protein
VEIWRAVPEGRREAALLACLAQAYLPVAHRAAALLAPELRSRALAAFLVDHVDEVDAPPRAEVLAIVTSIDPALGREVETLALEVTARFAPRAAADLAPIAQAQLLAALALYDGAAHPIEARLGEGDYDATGSVRGSVERVELSGEVAVDGFLYMGDSGTFFAHDTTEVVGEMIQGALECADPALGAALRKALR